jgi:nucleotide-binding universal stress UspA family protein
MSEASDFELRIRRILVALDASTHSLAALRAAAELAAGLQAELIGLYVEDLNLIRLAGLPFAHEVRSPSAARRRVTAAEIEQAMHREAARAQRAMREAAELAHARWTFRIVRGQVSQSILEAALEADLLALGRFSRPLSRRARLGSTARIASRDLARPVLMMVGGDRPEYPVLVTYDGSVQARKAVAAAVPLARGGRKQLSILLLAETAEASIALQQELADLRREPELKVDFRWLAQPNVDRLAGIVDAMKDCVLVLGGDNPLVNAESIQALLDRTDCPVLLVR